ncbi:MAG: hypothetical protein M3Z65_00785 [Chloroflexota bacterium]|nr:hypothetical protein [Chloroflexota bacterium]
MTEEHGGRRRAEFLTALTTEHVALQGARAGTISESAARSSLYMTTLSSAVVALALVAQLSTGGTLLGLFALTVLPVVFFLGVVTYGRLLQLAVEDVLDARAISRIRRYYCGIDPSRALLFHEAGVDGLGLRTAGVFQLRWQQFLPASAMVAIVNSVVGGVFVAAVSAAGLALPTSAATLIGAVATVLMATAVLMHQRRAWHRVDRVDPLTASNADPAPPTPAGTVQ